MTTPGSQSLISQLQRIVSQGDIRSADRANIVRIIHTLQHGWRLNYQDQQNAWAYIARYTRPPNDHEIAP